MRKLLLVMLVSAALAGSGGRASAWWPSDHHGPWAQTAAFPCANPPGWYTNTYSFAWQYPWFAYYNYSHGPYANWMAGGGYAYYATCTNFPFVHGVATGAAAPVAAAVAAPAAAPAAAPVMAPTAPCGCTVTVRLPAEAKLLFNGTAATGTGAVRTFATPPLEVGRDYGYDLTAEVVRDGKVERKTERVVVRAGEKATVTLALGGAK